MLGGPAECPNRDFCLIGLERTCRLHFDDFVLLDAGGPLTKTALRQGKIQLGLLLSTDTALEPESD